MPTVRVPVAALFSPRDSSVTTDSRLLNGYIEQDKFGTLYTVKRPGTAININTGLPSIAQGTFSWNGNLYNIQNDTLVAGPNPIPVSDGTNWSNLGAYSGNIPDNTSTTFSPIAYLNGTFYALDKIFFNTGTRYVYSSTDGIAWTRTAYTVDFAPSSPLVNYCFLSYSNALWIIAGQDSGGATTGTNAVFKSTNGGVSWIRQTAAAAFGVRWAASATVHNNLMYIMGGATTGTNLHDVWHSSDGITWTQDTAAAGWAVRAQFSSCSFNGNLWVIGGSPNDVWFSPTGVTWTQATAGPVFNSPSTLGLCVYNNKMWALDTNGTGGFRVLNSALGSSWTLIINSIPPASLFWVGYNNLYTAGTNMYIFGNTNLYKAVTNVPGGTPYPLTPTTPSLSFDFENASFAAGALGFMFKSTKDAYYFNNATLTKISSANYPATTVPGLVYIDGTYYVMSDTGKIFGSNLEDPLTWSALNVISANQEADKPVALARQLNYAVAFCENTTQFFYDAGNATGSPLSRVDNAFLRIGCASAGSIATTTGTLFWMGKTNQKGRSIYTFEGTQPVVISNQYVDRILNADNLSTVYSFCIRISGHLFYVLTLKSSNITLVCDVASQEWYKWSWLTPQATKSVTSLTQVNGLATATVASHGYADGDAVVIAGATPSGYNGRININVVDANTFTYTVSTSLASPATGTITAQGFTEGYMPFARYSFLPNLDLLIGENDGIIYEINPTYLNDNGNPIKFNFRTSKIDAGNNKKKYAAKVEVIGDKVNGTGYLRYTNDDYQTWSAFRPVSLSAQRSQLNRQGITRRRAYEYQSTDDIAQRIEALELTLEEGSK